MIGQIFLAMRGLLFLLMALVLFFMAWLFMAMRAATLVQAAVARSLHGSP